MFGAILTGDHDSNHGAIPESGGGVGGVVAPTHFCNVATQKHGTLPAKSYSAGAANAEVQRSAGTD